MPRLVTQLIYFFYLIKINKLLFDKIKLFLRFGFGQKFLFGFSEI